MREDDCTSFNSPSPFVPLPSRERVSGTKAQVGVYSSFSIIFLIQLRRKADSLDGPEHSHYGKSASILGLLFYANLARMRESAVFKVRTNSIRQTKSGESSDW